VHLLVYCVSDNMTFRILSHITITFQKKTEWYNNWHCNWSMMYIIEQRMVPSFMVLYVLHFLRSNLTFCFNWNCSDKVMWIFFSQFQSFLFVSRKCVFIMNGMLMGTIDNHQITYTDVPEVVLCEYSHHFLSVTGTWEKSISEALFTLNITI